MVMNWEPTKAKLNDPDLKKGLEAVTELRERIEVVHSPEYPSLLKSLLPIFIQILDHRTKPNADIKSDEQKIRRAILEVISRFPHNESLKEYALTLLECAMGVLTNDYEENSMVASRIVFDLHHKNFRPVMAEHVQPFLNFVLKSLKLLNNTVADLSSVDGGTKVPGSTKSVSSFKILTECPLTVMLLFQLYPKFIKSNIPNLLPLMMQALALKSPPNLPTLKARELVACQVKILSFLTYLIRGFGELMSRFKEIIAGNIVNLMKSCPCDAISTRKELLVATRRILATDFRQGFYPHIDALFDERALIGSNYRHHNTTSNSLQSDSLRPMGYSTLADLVHHVRSQLSLSQVSRVIVIFSRVIHDPSQPVSIQTTSARLLLNLVDHIFHSKESNDNTGRELLVQILDTLVRKFGSLEKYMEEVKEAAAMKAVDEDGRRRKVVNCPNDTLETNTKRKRGFALGGNPEITDTVHDIKMIIKPMIKGIKTVIWCIKNYRSRSQAGSKRSKASNSANASEKDQLSNVERALVVRYLTLALPCLNLFKWNENACEKEKEQNKQEFREVLEHFAASFTVLDSFDLQRTIGFKLPFLFDFMIGDPDLLTLPQHLIVSNKNVSFDFCEVLLAFLAGRMDELSKCDVTTFLIKSGSQTVDKMHSEGEVPVEARSAYTLLRLFKIVFQSVSLFPENEAVLRSYLQTLVAKCLKFATQVEIPGNYFYLMLRLFRSIAGGKFEHSYKELLPLLPTILNSLHRVYISTNDAKMRASIVEISLAIPARLSSLYPHLPLLSLFIVSALQCTNGDIVNLGLRTLEFWVDNLNPEYFYPILAMRESEIMVSLCNHLRPAPYPYGLLSLRLLGKLGGRNRLFLRGFMDIPSRKDSDFVELFLNANIDFKANGEKSAEACKLKIGPALLSAIEILRTNAGSPMLKPAPKPYSAPKIKRCENNNSSEELPYPLTFEDVLAVKAENVDLTKLALDVMIVAKRNQLGAAFQLLRWTSCYFCKEEGSRFEAVGINRGKDLDQTNQVISNVTKSICEKSVLYHVSRGLIYALVGDYREESNTILDGLMINIVLWLSKYVVRIDELGQELDETIFENIRRMPRILNQVDVEKGEVASEKDSSSNKHGSSSKKVKIQPLPVFGLFGVRANNTYLNPFVFNQVIVDVLSDENEELQTCALRKMKDLVEIIHQLNEGEVSPQTTLGAELLENLLFLLCRCCYEKEWNSKKYIYKAIMDLQKLQGVEWSLRFGTEIVHAALFTLKNCPRELSTLNITTSLTFLFETVSFLFRYPHNENEQVFDSLAIPKEFEEVKARGSYPVQLVHAHVTPEAAQAKSSGIDEVIVHLLIGELVSPKHVVRFAARICLQLVSKATKIPTSKLLSEFASLLKRMIFSRSLRHVSQADQIGIVDALTFVIEEAPSMYDLSDQSLLVHLSDLLRSASIVDSDKSSDPGGSSEKGVHVSGVDTFFKGCQFSSSRASTMFLREEVVMKVLNYTVIVPAELPYGEQLRVSSILLFRSVIRRHTKAFFSADTSPNIVNIRSHVINLLFRSLISQPPLAATVAFATLDFVIGIGNPEGQMSDIPPLDKNLLHVCIRPVLLNLKDHQKIDISLMEGMSRLLSLLSTMFNVALGEKLLDHLKNWERPKLIMDSKVWKAGEEPLVAASIISLFEFLPITKSTDFVEKLINAVIRLETVLSQYKEFSSTASPYRRPLIKYLSKFPEKTAAFFLNEKRLSSTSFSEFFQDLLNMPGSKSLRDFVSKKPLQVLKLCFERSILIIQSEKKYQEAKKTLSPLSLLTLHGIDTSGVQQQHITALRRDLELKKRNMKVQMEAEQKVKNALQSAIAAKEAPAVIQDHTEKHNKAMALYKKSQNDVGLAQAALTASSSTSNDAAAKDLPALPMSPDALEWLHQGLKIVQILVRHDEQFFDGTNHADLYQIYRLLWKSKGRYLRMIHDERLPAKFKTESEMIAKVLILYSERHPDDVDCLYDFLRVFLNPTGVDFTFVRTFLERMVTHELNLEQKKKLLRRFFLVIGGEGNDEVKVLSIQLLILPLLREGLEQENVNGKLGGEQPPTKGSLAYKATPKESDGDKGNKNSEVSRSELVGIEFIRSYMKVMKDGSSPRSERLHIELLKVSSLLIEFLWKEMVEHRKELIKFTWTHLKSDDSASKTWAYVNVCHFISRFDCPSKITLQVWIALLRTHQANKDLVRSAIDILVPSLPKRLPEEDFTKAIKWTKKIMFEEGHSIPQLTHMWETFVRHPSVFFNDRNLFVPHMVNSLNRLGLPPTSTIENRSLSLSVVDLIMSWEEHRLEISRGSVSAQDHVDKKTRFSHEMPKAGADFTMNKSMIDVVLNFLVRVSFFAAESKEVGARIVNEKGVSLFERGIKLWPQYDVVRVSYFDKIFTLTPLIETSQPAPSTNIEKTVKTKSSQKMPNKSLSSQTGQFDSSQSSPVKKDTESSPTEGMVTCLQLLHILIRSSPHQRFFIEAAEKLSKFIVPCFSQGILLQNKMLRLKLKEFSHAVFGGGNKASEPLLTGEFLGVFKTQIEHILAIDINTPDSDATKASSGVPDSKINTMDSDQFDNVRHGGRCSAYFVVELIEEVCRTNLQFLGYFSSSLLSLSQRLLKVHVQDASTATRRVTSMNSQMISRGVQQNLASSMIGILEEANDSSSGSISRTKDTILSDDRGMKEVQEVGSNIRSLISIIRLLGLKSDIPASMESDARRRLFQLLCTILEKSDCLALLLTATSIIGRWVVLRESPISVEERRRLLTKLNFKQVTEVPGEPLASIVANIVMRLRFKKSSTVKVEKRSSNGKLLSPIISQNVSAIVSDDDTVSTDSREELNDVINQLMMSHSLSADHGIRKVFIDRFQGANNSQMNVIEMFIVLLQSDWTSLGDKLWLHRFVQHLLSHEFCQNLRISYNDDPVRTAPLSLAKLAETSTGSRSSLKLKGVNNYERFMSVLDDSPKWDSMCSIIETLSLGDSDLCHHLFHELLQTIWVRCDDKMRDSITIALEKVLAQPHHAQFIYSSRFPFNPKYDNDLLLPTHGCNIIQTVLASTLKLRPIPKLDIDLLVYLGTKFNSWHEVIQIMETDLSHSLEDSKRQQALLIALRRCYDALNEKDLSLSLSQRLSKNVGTKRALSFEMYNMVSDALTKYNELINATNEEMLSNEELCIWESRFVDLNRESQQWAVLADYAKNSENPSVMMECAWKARDWKAVHSLLPSPSIVAGLEIGCPGNKIDEIYLAIGTGKLSEVEKLHLQAVQLCLHNWQLLPKLAPGCNAHSSLFQQFHRLVELRESGQIMVETGNHSTKGTLPDLKNLLSAWRNRLPNEHDPVSIWSDLLTWRSHIFSAITHNFQWSEPTALATLHDKPWTAIRMARAARKHKMKDVALMSLAKLTDQAMDVTDAFVKLREQIVLCRDSNAPQEYQNGLNIVQTTNLSFFDEKQKSELFRLKGIFFSNLKHKPQANQAFCHSIQICPNYGKAWSSWGDYCAGLSNHIENKIVAAGSGLKDKAPLTKKSIQYLVQAMGCYLEAVNCGDDDARLNLPKCMWMARRDGDKGKILSETLERRGKLLPEWMWIPWIPQLLTSLGRNEYHASKRILAGICVRYPQALYFFLRTYYLERLDANQNARPDKSTGKTASKDSTSSNHAQELVNTLRKSHPGLWVAMEAITDELINRFRPSFEEELPTAINALLQRALPQKELLHKRSVNGKDNSQALLASFSKTLNRVSAKFFRPVASDFSQSSDHRSRKEKEFSLRYKEMFEKDFLVKGSEKSNEFDLDIIIERLRKWKKLLLPQVALLPKNLPLSHLSPALAITSFDSSDLLDSQNNGSYKLIIPSGASREFTTTITAAAKSTAAAVAAAASAEGRSANSSPSSSVEIPGKYLTTLGARPRPELHPKLIRFSAGVEVMQRDGNAVRRLGMLGSDGKTYHFAFQYVAPYSTWSGERSAQVNFLFDHVIRKNLISARKNYSLKITPLIPLAQKLRMTMESLDEFSLDDVFKHDCKQHGKDPDGPKQFFRKEMAAFFSEKNETPGDSNKGSNEVNVTTKQLEVFNEICRSRVSNDILLQFLFSKFSDAESLFTFRKVFTNQLAANCLLQYTFCATDRTPPKFVFNARDGEVLTPDFQLSYSNRGLLEQKKLPFRLTRNIKKAIGETNFDGTFIPAMASMAGAFSAKASQMNSCLCLLLRDDIISWYASKSSVRSESETKQLERQLDPRILRNSELILSRFEECSPSIGADEGALLDVQLRKLIDSATSSENLANSNVSFQPWL